MSELKQPWFMKDIKILNTIYTKQSNTSKTYAYRW